MLTEPKSAEGKEIKLTHLLVGHGHCFAISYAFKYCFFRPEAYDSALICSFYTSSDATHSTHGTPQNNGKDKARRTPPHTPSGRSQHHPRCLLSFCLTLGYTNNTFADSVSDVAYPKIQDTFRAANSGVLGRRTRARASDAQ